MKNTDIFTKYVISDLSKLQKKEKELKNETVTVNSVNCRSSFLSTNKYYIKKSLVNVHASCKC